MCHIVNSRLEPCPKPLQAEMPLCERSDMVPDKSQKGKGRQKQPCNYQQPSPDATPKACEGNRSRAQHNPGVKHTAVPRTNAVTAVGVFDKWEGYSPIDDCRNGTKCGGDEAQTEEDHPPLAQAIASLTHSAAPRPGARRLPRGTDTASPAAKFRSRPRRQSRHRAGGAQTARCRWSRPRRRDG